MEKPIGNEGSFHCNWFITIEIESIYFLALNRGFQLWIAIVLDWETIFHGLPFPNDLSLKLRYQIQICVSKRFQSIISCHDSSILRISWNISDHRNQFSPEENWIPNSVCLVSPYESDYMHGDPRRNYCKSIVLKFYFHLHRNVDYYWHLEVLCNPILFSLNKYQKHLIMVKLDFYRTLLLPMKYKKFVWVFVLRYTKRIFPKDTKLHCNSNKEIQCDLVN